MALNETTIRQEIGRVFKSLGDWPITQTDATRCPKCGCLVKPPIGRPDIIIPKAVCEVKVVPKSNGSFPFENIRAEQRQWLDAWTEAHGEGAYLGIGTLVPRQRRLWILPWTAWRQLEDTIAPIQSSVPVIAGKGMRKKLQENHLDLHTLLRDWELTRITGGWELSPKLGGILCGN
jgi:hypothetical protein